MPQCQSDSGWKSVFVLIDSVMLSSLIKLIQLPINAVALDSEAHLLERLQGAMPMHTSRHRHLPLL